MLVPEVRTARCAPKSHPCPRCGKPGRRVRRLHRRLFSLAYRRRAYTDVYYAEYKARCRCRKSFRSWPLGVPPKADYDDAVRAAVLDRILDDGLNVQRCRAAIKRDFLLELSEGFVYDCLRWKVAQLDMAAHRTRVLEEFSGTLCVDELHLGRFTLLLATDPVADLPVAFALVGRNDAAHMRRFLGGLENWGLRPRVVVTDGSDLYPAVLAQLWPAARHQLCVFHLLADINDWILKAVRRLADALARRGSCGRKRKAGRPSERRRAARAGAGPTLREKAAFVRKHRFLIVTKTSELDRQRWADLARMFAYLPELRTLWYFACELQGLFEAGARVQTLYKRRAALLGNEAYRAVPELARAVEVLRGEKFGKAVAFVYSAAGERVRTNNHVERANRRLRFWEKLRYKWRRRKWLVRFVVLALDRWWHQAAQASQPDQAAKERQQRPPSPFRATG